MWLSVFAEYDRVGAYFEAPTLLSNRRTHSLDLNSTTTRLGSHIGWGPITFTLEQRAHKVSPITMHLGSFHVIHVCNSWPGRVTAALDQGVNGDSIFPRRLSAGLSWNVESFTRLRILDDELPKSALSLEGIRARRFGSVSHRGSVGELIFISTSTVPRMRTLNTEQLADSASGSRN